MFNKNKDKQPKKELINGLVFIHADNGGGHKLREKDATLTKPPLRAIRWKKNWLNGNVPLYLFYEAKVTDEKGVVTYPIKPYDWEADKPVVVTIVEGNNKKSITLTPFVIFDLNDWTCAKDFMDGGDGKIQEMLKTGAIVVMACVCLFVTFIIATELNKPKAPGVPVQAIIQEVR